MSPRRFATVAAALTVVLAGWVVAWFAEVGSGRIVSTAAAPILDRGSTTLSAEAELASPRSTAMGNSAVGKVVVAAAGGSVTGTASDTTPGSYEPESVLQAAFTDSWQMLSPETPPVPMMTAARPARDDAKKELNSVEILDECPVIDICIDRYLWALYQRAPKEDTIKLEERRKVTVKRKGKMLTVIKTFTKLVDDDFTWKDPKAAEKAGMPMIDYVIGGMDRSLKHRLFHALHAAEDAGLSPGITSGFRDDYRQSIASGLKAVTNRSYHGGSLRGGYGHGLAADVVSVNGATRDQRWNSSENLWKWIDAHGKQFGIGRPYLARDPAHVAPIDGHEYAAHRRETKTQYAGSNMKKRKGVAVRDDHNTVKRSKRKIVEGESHLTQFKRSNTTWAN